MVLARYVLVVFFLVIKAELDQDGHTSGSPPRPCTRCRLRSSFRKFDSAWRRSTSRRGIWTTPGWQRPFLGTDCRMSSNLQLPSLVPPQNVSLESLRTPQNYVSRMFPNGLKVGAQQLSDASLRPQAESLKTYGKASSLLVSQCLSRILENVNSLRKVLCN